MRPLLLLAALCIAASSIDAYAPLWGSLKIPTTGRSNCGKLVTQQQQQPFKQHQQATGVFSTTNEEDFRPVDPDPIVPIQTYPFVPAFFLVVVLPSLGLWLFPYLLANIVDFSLDTISRQYYIIALLLSKRVYLYAVAFVTLILSARRASIDAVGNLGQRLEKINSEIFSGVIDDLVIDDSLKDALDALTNDDYGVDEAEAGLTPLDNSSSSISSQDIQDIQQSKENEKQAKLKKQAQLQAQLQIQEDNKVLYSSLDAVSEETQATLLPVAFAIALGSLVS